jgi:beta-aspartyl-peptidase (threonine type)
LAEKTATVCASPSDVRRIEVIAPGDVGAACDLRYVRERGANISIPFHANNDASWCDAKARDLVEQLSAEGFSCGSAETSLAASESARAVPAEPVRPPTELAGATLEPAAAEASTPNPFSAEDDLAAARRQKAEADSVALTEAAPAQVDAEIAAPALAGGAPVDLMAAAAPIMVRAPKPQSGGAGRLVGVTPGARATAPTLASAAGAPTPILTLASRPAEEVIEGVLSAQVAAWNDGDLDGFMAGYWNSPDLVVVAGAEKAVGWKEAERRYKARYRGPEEFGRLTHEAIEVAMVDPATARVTGRYRHEQAGATTSGRFILTMKDFDGRWRIVHDQTTPDAAPVTP